MQYFVPHELIPLQNSLLPLFSPFMTAERTQRFESVSKNRSRHVACVFENTHHSHNVSAVLRSMDALGFQDAFFLYNNPHLQFPQHSSIERGSSQWLSIRRTSSFENLVSVLKANGYLICAISLPHFSRTSSVYSHDVLSFPTSTFSKATFQALLATNRLALVFGSELYGLHEDWHKVTDVYLSVDMFGFVESLNVSVCAGIILNQLRQCLSLLGASAVINESERALLLEHWYAKSFPLGEKIITNQHPNLHPWYEFMKQGKFYNPFS